MEVITNEEVKKFLSGTARVMSEKLASLDANTSFSNSQWVAKITALLAPYADGDTIENLSGQVGHSVVTKADLVAFMGVLTALEAQFNSGTVRDKIYKLTVRDIIV